MTGRRHSIRIREATVNFVRGTNKKIKGLLRGNKSPPKDAFRFSVFFFFDRSCG
jgi:hypothetical protein